MNNDARSKQAQRIKGEPLPKQEPKDEVTAQKEAEVFCASILIMDSYVDGEKNALLQSLPFIDPMTLEKIESQLCRLNDSHMWEGEEKSRIAAALAFIRENRKQRDRGFAHQKGGL